MKYRPEIFDPLVSAKVGDFSRLLAGYEFSSTGIRFVGISTLVDGRGEERRPTRKENFKRRLSHRIETVRGKCTNHYAYLLCNVLKITRVRDCVPRIGEIDEHDD